MRDTEITTVNSSEVKQPLQNTQGIRSSNSGRDFWTPASFTQNANYMTLQPITFPRLSEDLWLGSKCLGRVCMTSQNFSLTKPGSQVLHPSPPPPSTTTRCQGTHGEWGRAGRGQLQISLSGSIEFTYGVICITNIQSALKMDPKPLTWRPNFGPTPKPGVGRHPGSSLPKLGPNRYFSYLSW